METQREHLILKWLDDSLTPEERQAFERLDDYEQLIKLGDAAHAFKAPDFDSSQSFEELNTFRQTKNPTQKLWPNLLKIASILIIALVTYFGFFHTTGTQISTEVAQQEQLILADNSQVVLNGDSQISYSEKDWETNRTLQLEGEAYFKVSKGQTFTVETEKGNITVLGTQFNVKLRDDILEVTCYEGLVSVTSGDIYRKLSAGEALRITHENDALALESPVTQAQWLEDKSMFSNASLTDVFTELERYYDVNITLDNISTTDQFTGGFGYDNLELSLKSITQPMQLEYAINGKNVRIYAVE